MIRFSFITARAASLLLGVIALGLPTIHAVDPRPLTLDELFKFQRVSDPQVSPDGRHVVYVVTEVLKEENRTQSDLWLAPTIGEAAPRRLTFGPTHDRHPRWSPDGRWIAFESNREGDYQIYLLPVADQGGEARRLTTLATGATGAVWAPAGDQLAFVSEVFPEFSHEAFAEAEAHARARIAAEAKAPVKARVATQLLYRHWDAWVGGRRQHLFVIPVRDGAATGEPRNVTPGDNDAVPTSSTFSAGDDHAFSPDGASLAFTAPPLPVREQAWSTNHDLWLVNLATLERRHLTTNPAADGYPRFSPDGRTLAYRAQARAGFGPTAGNSGNSTSPPARPAASPPLGTAPSRRSCGRRTGANSIARPRTPGPSPCGPCPPPTARAPRCG